MSWNTVICDKLKPKEDFTKVKDPPCRYCKFWKPKRTFEDYGSVIYTHVDLCHAYEMYRDFSCFRDRQNDLDK